MTKIVLVGAGSLQFGSGMLGDIFQSRVLADAEVVLNDINEPAALKMKAIADAFASDRDLKQTIRVESDLSKALAGADFVVISIEVGDRFKLWELDWNVPQQYGISQVYGENGGPGGLFHSLRIIPPILDICGKIMDHAPNATVFNFSNPMSRITTTVYRAFPDIKFLGMCHEIASLETHLPPLLDQPRENIHYRAGGLNHFSVMTQCTYQDSGKDAYPDVRKKAGDYFSRQPGFSEILKATRETGEAIQTEGWMKTDLSHISEVRSWSDRRLFKVILENFGVLPITYDSHFGEYIGWAHDCADQRGILDFYSYYRHFVSEVPPKIESEMLERIVPIIEGILTGEAYEEAAVNIPNSGLIEDLPEWIAVEVPAVVNSSGVKGIKVDVPAGMRGLLANQIGVHNLTAEAVLQKSKEAAVQALLVDPVVTISNGIGELFDHMAEEQSPWLDYLK